MRRQPYQHQPVLVSEQASTENVKEFISSSREMINGALIKYLPPTERSIRPSVNRAIRHSALNGGHRYRPILLLAVADSFEINRSNALPIACVVEMIHTAAMIIDDLPSFDNA